MKHPRSINLLEPSETQDQRWVTQGSARGTADDGRAIVARKRRAPRDASISRPYYRTGVQGKPGPGGWGALLLYGGR